MSSRSARLIARFLRTNRIVIACGSLALALLLTCPLAVLAQEPIVQPGDVSAPSEHTAAGMDAAVGYTVLAGDTLLTVALETGLDLDDVPCAIGPDFRLDQPLVIGDILTIPPANLACHTVVAGDTLASIAAAYGSNAEQIHLLGWNRLTAVPLEAALLREGTHLRVPLPLGDFLALSPTPADQDSLAGAVPGAAMPEGLTAAAFLPLMLSMPVDTSPFAVLGQGSSRPPRHQVIGPVPADWPYGSGRFTWPVYGWLSQSYRYDHRAIDVAANLGTPVTASDRGVVLRAGWNDQGYGQFVIIDHQIDYVTLYAHLDSILVQEGDVVGQGQAIGTVGSTGNSSGPHLHFEIRDFGRLSNPLELLAGP